MARPVGNPNIADHAVKWTTDKNVASIGGNAMATKRMLTEELKAIGRQIAENTPYGTITRIQALAYKYWDMALDGNEYAMKEILERMDGKVKQVTVLNGDEDGGAVRFERVERIIVKADASNTNGGSVPAIPTTRAV